MLTIGLVVGAFAGTIGTAGAEDLQSAYGAYFPWVPNGETLDGMGPFYGAVTVQNLQGEPIDIYVYPGVGSGSQAYGSPEVIANVQSFASVTLTAEQIGVSSPGGSVHAVAETVEDGAPALIAGSVKNVGPVESSNAKTSSAHITVDGYTGMTDDQVNDDDDTQILPIVQTNSGWDTKVRIASFAGEGNPNPTTAYTVTLYEAGGQGSAGPSSGEFTGLIAGGETVSIDIMDAPGINEGWVGNAFITSNAPIGAIAERYKTETEMLLTNVSRPVINGGNGGPQTTSYAPLVFQNYNFWNTGISVANLDDNNSNTVTLTYFTAGGSQVGTDQVTIPPRGMEFVFTPGTQNLGLGGNIGAAVISGTTALQAAVDQVKYFGGDEEVGDAMSYVTDHDPTEGGYALALPLVQKGNPATGLGDTSGVQFFNPNPVAQANFDISVFNTTGNLVAPTLNVPVSFSLSGHQGVTFYTHNYSEMPAGFQGSLTAAVNSGELTGVSNNVNYDVQNDGAVAYNLVKITRVGTDLEIEQSSAENLLGEIHVVTATLFDQFGQPLPNEDVTITVEHENQADGDVSNETLSGQTNSDGQFSITYVRTDGAELGDETIVAVHEDAGESEELTKSWDANIELSHAEEENGGNNNNNNDDTAVNPIGTDHTVIATVTDVNDNPVANAVVDFTVTGDGNPTPPTGSDTTGNDGEAEFTFTNDILGTNQIVAELSATGTQSNTITKEWVNLLVNGDFEAFTGSLPDGAIAGDDSSDWYQWFAQATWNIEDDGTGNNNIATQDPANDNQGGSITQAIRQVIDGSLVPSGSTLEISFDYRSATTGRVIVYGMTADDDWYQFPVGSWPMGVCGDGSDPNASGFEECDELLDTTFGPSATFTSFSTTFPVNEDFVAIGVGIQLGGSTTGTDPRRAIDNVVLTFAP